MGAIGERMRTRQDALSIPLAPGLPELVRTRSSCMHRAKGIEKRLLPDVVATGLRKKVYSRMDETEN